MSLTRCVLFLLFSPLSPRETAKSDFCYQPTETWRNTEKHRATTGNFFEEHGISIKRFTLLPLRTQLSCNVVSIKITVKGQTSRSLPPFEKICRYVSRVDSRENKRHSSFVSIFRLLVELCVIFWRDTLHGNWLSDINLRQPAYREYYAVDIEILAGSMIACFRWSSGVNIASRGSFVIENGIKRSPRRSYSHRWLQSLIEKINEPVEPTRFVFVPRDRFNAPLS